MSEARRHPRASGGLAPEHLQIGGLASSILRPSFGERLGAFQLERDASPRGFLNSAVAGRTDRLPLNVAADSYVLPADVVSGLGQGNSLNGSRVLDEILRTGPYGTRLDRFHAPQSQLPSPPASLFRAEGGRAEKQGPVPIMAAGGEYIVHPDVVKRLGKGDYKAGHDKLDEMVRRVRKHVVDKLRRLPAPKK